MNIVNRPNEVENVGYLVVRVSTARGAIPLANASVSVRGSTPETSNIIYSLSTNSDGITKRIELPTPPLALSKAPGDTVPYSLWNVDVFMQGYIPVSYQNLPVYPSVVSVQPAVMVPVGEGYSPRTDVNESGAPAL
jgi:hypothetical protein